MNITAQRIYWLPDNQMRAAIIALNSTGRTIEQIAVAVGTNVNFVRLVLGL
jgi:predicted transcriptional regulator